MEQNEHPICYNCANCQHCGTTGKVRNVICSKNPNLGAVTINYQKCCSFRAGIGGQQTQNRNL